MAGDVLGSEWGALAGLPVEEGLQHMANYAATLEEKLDSPGTPQDPPKPKNVPAPDALETARTLKQTTMAPHAGQFIAKREAAKSAARMTLIEAGQDWDAMAPYLDQVMVNAQPDQQTQESVWVEAYWYAWGQAKRLEATTPPPRSEGDDEPGETHRTVDVTDPNVSRGSRRRVPEEGTKRFVIEDPIEQNTKRKMEKYIGYKIGNEEWHRLQNEDINTLEEYEQLQKELNKGKS